METQISLILWVPIVWLDQNLELLLILLVASAWRERLAEQEITLQIPEGSGCCTVCRRYPGLSLFRTFNVPSKLQILLSVHHMVSQVSSSPRMFCLILLIHNRSSRMILPAHILHSRLLSVSPLFASSVHPSLKQMILARALERLNVSYCALPGPHPANIWNLENLESLDLCGNILSGTLPPSLSNLKMLRELGNLKMLTPGQIISREPQAWESSILVLAGLSVNLFSGNLVITNSPK
ncbi:hypothetical protein MKW98_029507 [Papaver atlanticum]|uniref:Uncharacterized protein n=1 Tax=Papaver atlanticum TaxID=357466 RepID=A0AAD4XEY4_9MAGN|nr:hypothetical protein MKW98_029507 [Papaver atlanticum]